MGEPARVRRPGRCRAASGAPIRLIVNADDLGLSEAIDDGIFRAAREGIVRSASILAAGRSFERAARLARDAALGLGVHFALSGGLPTVLPPVEVPTLLSGGVLRRSWAAFTRDFLAGAVSPDEIERELDAQVRCVLAAGLEVDHVDGHQHLHVMPGVLPRVLKVCERHGIRAIRLPVERPVEGAGLPRQLKRSLVSSLARGARISLPDWMRAPDEFHGLAGGGHLDRTALAALIDGLGEGTHELGCHPGARDEPVPEDSDWRYGWTAELEALVDPEIRRKIDVRGIALVRFRDL